MDIDTPRALLIINPIAGNGKKAGLDAYIKSRLGRQGWSVDVTHTRGHGDATALAAEAVASAYDVVIAAGGDGTVNEVAAALCDTPATLAIVPCGSGNGLARHLGIPVDAKEAVDVMCNGKRSLVDYGLLNGHHFFCTCGMGFDAQVSVAFAAGKGRGLMSYLKSVAAEYRGYHPRRYHIVADGGERTIDTTAVVLSVCNASQYGNNAFIAPAAVSDDGHLDVTLVRPGSIADYVMVAIRMLLGNIYGSRRVDAMRIRHVVIEADGGCPVHIDGEPMEIVGPIDIECRKGLRVVVPHERPQFTPVITPLWAFSEDLRLRLKHLFGPGY